MRHFKQNLRSFFHTAATAVYCLLAAGCATPRNQISTGPLKPGEIVHVHFSKAVGDAAEASPDFVRTVGDDGIISIQSTTIAVAGLTPAQASAKIREAFANHSLPDEVELRRINPSPNVYADNEAQTKFGIFLTVNPNLDTRPGMVDLSHVQLAASPVISAEDIISYDFTTHAMKLRHKPMAGVSLAPGQLVRGLPFVVVANGQRIYLGAFTSEVSSISLDVPSIVAGRFNTPEDVAVIDRAYPNDKFGEGPDPRTDPRIKSALAALHKLQ
jgi:hypothetical protein